MNHNAFRQTETTHMMMIYTTECTTVSLRVILKARLIFISVPNALYDWETVKKFEMYDLLLLRFKKSVNGEIFTSNERNAFALVLI